MIYRISKLRVLEVVIDNVTIHSLDMINFKAVLILGSHITSTGDALRSTFTASLQVDIHGLHHYICCVCNKKPIYMT